mgnify:CR=1 FL=1
MCRRLTCRCRFWAAAAGTAIWGFVGVFTREFDAQVFGGAAALGSLGGLILAMVLTDGDTEPTHNGPAADVEVSGGVTPTDGGGMFSLDGRF